MRAYHAFGVLHACCEFYCMFLKKNKDLDLSPFLQSDPRFLGTLKQVLKTPEKGGLTSNVRWVCSPRSRYIAKSLFRVSFIDMM
jgi:hypothetical protein